MRVILFTSQEPLYLPRYLQPILEAQADSIERVVITPFDSPTTKQLREQIGMYGLRAGSRMAVRYLRSRLLDSVPGRLGWHLTGRYHSVRAVAQAYDIPVERVPDVNDPEFVDRVQSLAPDLLLSIVAGQRFSEPLLESTNDCINLHGSLLPKYRGRATAFWPLYYGDDRTGVTAHRMTERFDAGPILTQRSFPTESTDTVDSIYQKLAATGAALGIDLLDRYPDTPCDRPNETAAADYHGLPGPQERQRFYDEGNRFL